MKKMATWLKVEIDGAVYQDAPVEDMRSIQEITMQPWRIMPLQARMIKLYLYRREEELEDEGDNNLQDRSSEG